VVDELNVEIVKPLTPETIKEMKMVFMENPGETVVAISAQGKKISTSYRVKNSEKVRKKIQEIIKNSS